MSSECYLKIDILYLCKLLDKIHELKNTGGIFLNIKEISLANITLPSNVLMAPLAGYTCYPFRMMCAELGAGLRDCCYLEQITITNEQFNFGSYAFSGCTSTHSICISDRKYLVQSYENMFDKHWPEIVKTIYHCGLGLCQLFFSSKNHLELVESNR